MYCYMTEDNVVVNSWRLVAVLVDLSRLPGSSRIPNSNPVPVTFDTLRNMGQNVRGCWRGPKANCLGVT